MSRRRWFRTNQEYASDAEHPDDDAPEAPAVDDAPDRPAGPAEGACRFLKKAEGDAKGGEAGQRSTAAISSAQERRHAELQNALSEFAKSREQKEWAQCSDQLQRLIRLVDSRFAGSRKPIRYIRAITDANRQMATARATAAAGSDEEDGDAPAASAATAAAEAKRREEEKQLAAFKMALRRVAEDLAEVARVTAHLPLAADDPPPRTVKDSDDDDDDDESGDEEAAEEEWDDEKVEAKLAEIGADAARVKLPRRTLLATLRRMLASAVHPALKAAVAVLEAVVLVDTPTRSLAIPAETWRRAYSLLVYVLHLAATHPDQLTLTDGGLAGPPEPAAEGSTLRAVRVPGGFATLAERLDDEYTNALRLMDIHTQTADYLGRLRDEGKVCDLLERALTRALAARDRPSSVRAASALLTHLTWRRQGVHQLLVARQRALRLFVDAASGTISVEEMISGTAEDLEAAAAAAAAADKDADTSAAKVATAKADAKAAADASATPAPSVGGAASPAGSLPSVAATAVSAATMVGKEKGPKGRHVFYNLGPSIAALLAIVQRWGDERQKAAGVLGHVAFLAQDGRYDDARTLLATSRVSDVVAAAGTVPLMALLNRAIAAIGVAAFAAGRFRDTAMALSDLLGNMGVVRARELLLQSLPAPNRFGDSRPVDRSERLRLMPAHTHLNADVVEAAYLASALLTEIPHLAAQPVQAHKILHPMAPAASRATTLTSTSKLLPKYLNLQISKSQFLGPPDSLRDYIFCAYRALIAGEWQACADALTKIPVWAHLPNPDAVRALLADKAKDACLRVYLCVVAPSVYSCVPVSHLSALFAMPEARVIATASRCIASSAIAGASIDLSLAPGAGSAGIRLADARAVALTPLQVSIAAAADSAMALLDINERGASEIRAGTDPAARAAGATGDDEGRRPRASAAGGVRGGVPRGGGAWPRGGARYPPRRP